MEKSKATQYAADAVLSAVYDHHPEDPDFRAAAEKLCQEFPELVYDSNPNVMREKVRNAESFIRICLEQLDSVLNGCKSYHERLHFAVVCNIETFSSTLYDFRKNHLFDAGKDDELAAQFPLFLLSSYLTPGKTTAKMPDDLIRPLFVPEEPTPNTKQKYSGRIRHILEGISQEIHKIPYLSGDIPANFAEESGKSLEEILRGARPRQLEDFHSLIPLREFKINMKEEPSNGAWGTAATFTFGILLK